MLRPFPEVLGAPLLPEAERGRFCFKRSSRRPAGRQEIPQPVCGILQTRLPCDLGKPIHFLLDQAYVQDIRRHVGGPRFADKPEGL